MAEGKKQTDWEAIEQEWKAGQRDVKEIAREHGISDAAIHQRAKRKGWPPRPVRQEVVSRLVSPPNTHGPPANNPRLALTTFQRCIELLHRHRALLGALNAGIVADLEAAEVWRREIGSKRRLKLDEVRTLMEINTKAAQALARLIPLERRAFGIGPDDVPSEFDGLTADELAAVIETIRRATQT
jgi:hypothetical protein